MIRTCAVMAVAGLAAAAGADAVHHNITNESTRFQGITNFDPQLVLFDDLVPDHGGELQSLTFTYGFVGGFGGPGQIALDIGISLLIDDGDGVLEPGTDATIFTTTVGLIANQGVMHQATVQITPGTNIADGSRIWFGAQYAPDTFGFVNLGSALYNDYTRGSSDSNIYIYNTDDSSTQTFFQADGAGVGAILRVVPAPSAAAAIGLAGLAAARRRR